MLYGGGFAQLGAQALGALIIVAWTLLVSAAAFAAIRRAIGLRVSARYELVGMDYAEHGGGAYPEFQQAARPPQGNVAIVHFAIHGAAELFDWRPDMLERASKTIEAIVTRAAASHSGYVTVSRPLDEEPAQIVFISSAGAIRWAMEVSSRLLEVRWPADAAPPRPCERRHDRHDDGRARRWRTRRRARAARARRRRGVGRRRRARTATARPSRPRPPPARRSCRRQPPRSPRSATRRRGEAARAARGDGHGRDRVGPQRADGARDPARAARRRAP